MDSRQMLDERLENMGDDERVAGAESDGTAAATGQKPDAPANADTSANADTGDAEAPGRDAVVNPFAGAGKGDDDNEVSTEDAESSSDVSPKPSEEESDLVFKEQPEGDEPEDAESEAEDAEAGPAPEPEPPVNPKFRWYAVHTYSGHENKVRNNLLKRVEVDGVEERFGQILVPTEEVTEMKQGKKSVSNRKYFPSYILVEMEMCDQAFHLVNQISGVTRFVGLDPRDNTKRPVPLRPKEVDRVLGRIERPVMQRVTEIPYCVGNHVRVIDGPFSDFNGIVDDVNGERGTLKVMVTIFGRETPVELDFLQVEPL